MQFLEQFNRLAGAELLDHLGGRCGAGCTFWGHGPQSSAPPARALQRGRGVKRASAFSQLRRRQEGAAWRSVWTRSCVSRSCAGWPCGWIARPPCPRLAPSCRRPTGRGWSRAPWYRWSATAGHPQVCPNRAAPGCCRGCRHIRMAQIVLAVEALRKRSYSLRLVSLGAHRWDGVRPPPGPETGGAQEILDRELELTHDATRVAHPHGRRGSQQFTCSQPGTYWR